MEPDTLRGAAPASHHLKVTKSWPLLSDAPSLHMLVSLSSSFFTFLTTFGSPAISMPGALSFSSHLYIISTLCPPRLLLALTLPVSVHLSVRRACSGWPQLVGRLFEKNEPHGTPPTLADTAGSESKFRFS